MTPALAGKIQVEHLCGLRRRVYIYLSGEGNVMVDNANEATTAAELAQGSTFKFANERTEAMLRLQKELLEVYDQANRDWRPGLKRKQSMEWACHQARRNALGARRHAVISGVHVTTGEDGCGRRTTDVRRLRKHPAKDQPIVDKWMVRRKHKAERRATRH
jgi:hypothetical protein